MEEKKCTGCKEIKPLDCFGKKTDGLDTRCRECIRIRDRIYYQSRKKAIKKRSADYHHTKKGLIVSIHSNQKESSKTREHNPPEYSREELHDWCFSQDIFHVLFYMWKKSGYDMKLTPSVDRKDDDKGYTFENVQIVVWRENNMKGVNDMSRRGAKKVIATNIKSGRILEFGSIRKTEKNLKIDRSSISLCCHGRANQAGGYLFSFK